MLRVECLAQESGQEEVQSTSWIRLWDSFSSDLVATSTSCSLHSTLC